MYILYPKKIPWYFPLEGHTIEKKKSLYEIMKDPKTFSKFATEFRAQKKWRVKEKQKLFCERHMF